MTFPGAGLKGVELRAPNLIGRGHRPGFPKLVADGRKNPGFVGIASRITGFEKGEVEQYLGIQAGCFTLGHGVSPWLIEKTATRFLVRMGGGSCRPTKIGTKGPTPRGEPTRSTINWA